MSLPLAALGAVIAALLEASVLPDLTVAGIKPDLVYVFTVVSVMLIGVEDGLIWASLGGVVLDVLTPQRPLGATMLSLLVVAGIAIAISRALGPGRLPFAIVGAFGLTWVYQFLLLAILGATSGVSPALPVRTVAGISVFNLVIAVVIGLAIRWLIIRVGPPERALW